MSFVKDMLKARSDRHRMPPEYYGEAGHDYVHSRHHYNPDYARYDNRRSDYTHQEPYYGSYGRDYEHSQQSYDRGYNEVKGSDYGEMKYGILTDEDIRKWSNALLNSDGTTGKHFKKDQIEHIIKQKGINLHHIDEEVFCMTVNMLYADYCGVAKSFGVSVPEFYVELAKAFLEDKDFHGEPEEKLWLYYKCIAEQD